MNIVGTIRDVNGDKFDTRTWAIALNASMFVGVSLDRGM